METKNDDWFEEKHENISLRFRLKRRLFSEQSDFQKVEVVETQEHGMLLAHDGMIMVTEKDEFVYHDMITHVPLFTHPNPKNVLVIGGGDGGTVREVLKHPSVVKVTMVEIDGMVVDVSKKYIQKTACDLENSKVTLLIQDGVDFMKSSKETFDVIIVDSSEPIGPATPLFNVDFYKDIYSRLSDDGIVVSQGESPYYDMKMQKVLVEILAQVFPKVHIYNYCNMSYPSGLWSFTYASKGLCPFKDFDPNRVKKDFHYYSPEIHWGSFMLPQFIFNEHKKYLSPIPKMKWL
jgi:spermidine synthase